MKKEKIKVYTYTRVSTTMQVDGYSLDAQKAKMKAYADYNDYEIAGEYEDAGKSGKAIEGRAQFGQMMEDIKSVKTAYLMCWCSNCPASAEMRRMCFLPFR
ncbi:MAG: recombinase family protein [Phascolarctobacterium sp.]|nr:recombinase family protein [Phascolarctobacterium sp.]MDO4922058.1 recombinase family protein [Phascolarctobacterium sp.]